MNNNIINGEYLKMKSRHLICNTALIDIVLIKIINITIFDIYVVVVVAVVEIIIVNLVLIKEVITVDSSGKGQSKVQRDNQFCGFLCGSDGFNWCPPFGGLLASC